MKRPRLFALAAPVLFAWLGYRQLAAPWGEQRVAYVPAAEQCLAAADGSWRACLHDAPQGTNGGLAYLLHGRNLDEHTWNDDTFYTAMLQAHFAARGLKPPRVATVSFGPLWVLAPKTDNPNSGLLERFRDEVMPAVEAKTGAPSYRVVFGESMGGLNALLAGLRLPGTFRRAVALCPPLYDVAPGSGARALRAFLTRTGADPKIVAGLLWLARDFAATDADWKAISPALLLEGVDAQAAPALYVSAGLYDAYGSYEGAQSFAQKASQRGLTVEWRPLYGGHCAIDVVSVAEQLLP